MEYISTRGQDGPLGYEQALLSGLARDGGLYLPVSYPRFGEDEIRAMLQNAGFEDIQITVKENGRDIVKDWIPGSGAENYVTSAYVTATKPRQAHGFRDGVFYGASAACCAPSPAAAACCPPPAPPAAAAPAAPAATGCCPPAGGAAKPAA